MCVRTVSSLTSERRATHTSGLVADELTAVDLCDAVEQRQHVVLTQRLRQVVHYQVRLVHCS